MVVLFVNLVFVKVEGWKGGGKRGTDEHVKLANRLQKSVLRAIFGGLEEEVKDKRMENHFTPAPKRGIPRNQLLRNHCHSMPGSTGRE